MSEGVPPPKKMLLRRARPHERARAVELGKVGGKEARLVDAAEAHVAVEVAVGALLRAERPVDVDAEAAVSRRAARGMAR